MQPNPCSLARSMAEDIHALEQALSFVQHEESHDLALALSCFHNIQALPQAEIEQVLEQDTMEVLLTAFSWRLLIPAPGPRASMAWEEAEAVMHPQTVWKQPPVISHLVQRACTTGCWQPERTLPLTSSTLAHNLEAMTDFIECTRQYAPGYVLSANLLRAALHEAGIHPDLEKVIIDFKAAGVLSPRLSSLSDAARHRSPLYEINPSVFILSPYR
ncbi:MAG: hypothetical protein R6U55_14400 [Desulfovermiculus sp.]